MLLYISILTTIILILLLIYIILNKFSCDDENIMEDMSTVDQDRENLKIHAHKIASMPSDVKIKNCKRKLIKNLNLCYRNIEEGYNFLNEQFENRKEIVQCARWILDNFYLVQREYKDIRYNMPLEYYKSLPIMKRGYMKGYPRIYYIAVEMLSRTYGKTSEENIEIFINAYQENTLLTIGEIWAFPIMLRIALIQNISVITNNIVCEQKEKNRGEIIANRIIDINSKNKIDQIQNLKDENIKFTPAFTERLIKILRDNFIQNSEVYKWIDGELSKQDGTIDLMTNIDHQNQSNYQISMSNSFNAIRDISTLNWRKNFERLSNVEKILRKDPLEIYENMDFKSRDYYRHCIEKLSKRFSLSEGFIAKKSIECAEEALNQKKNGLNVEEYKMHVGYYIIDKGFECLKNKIKDSGKNYKCSYRNNIVLTIGEYIWSIIAVTVIASAFISYMDIYNPTYNNVWKYIITFILLAVPISEIFISLFNYSINKLVEPKFIPKLEFKSGIPDKYTTMVVIPTILNNVNELKNIIEEIEVYYLANQEKNLYFAILSDFKDSINQHEQDDKLIVDTAIDMIKKLNMRYCGNNDDKFYFFSRYRRYNECEKKWIGWERKRGKIMEFSYLMRGSDSTSYDVMSGDIKKLNKVKYIITLDADTKLPKDTAKVLIGAMAHVLNRPYLINGKVIRGHGLMQPRISVGTLSANKTIYSNIFSGETGIDLYTNAISNVYEDLFDEGIFTGKGIYDIDTFITVLKDKIPENSVLSHDLLEGCYVRGALVTDIELIDGYPAYYNASSKRLHRWVRGDWQLIPWIFKNKGLNKLSIWKIIDNLRRSLISPSIIALIFWSLIVFKNPDKGLSIALITLICPVFFNVSDSVVLPSRGISLSGRVNSFKITAEQFILIFIFIPYKAYLMMDAIFRTLYRMFISKQHLLEWQTAADVELKSGKKFIDYIKSMYSGSTIAVLIEVLAFYNSQVTGFLLLPSCIVWALSPYIAYKISQDKNVRYDELSSEEIGTLREISRRTWAYFEDFITEKSNWLAPDNYQEDPPVGLAYRTSPTNIAMGITSNLVAYDLGYITIGKLQYRLENIVSAMETLDRFNGHFYNWYDIKTKEPLNKYISTVDSGNLVCYICLTEETLCEYLKSPIINKDYINGIEDTIKLANYEINKSVGVKNVYEENMEQLKRNMNIYNLQEILKDLREKSNYILHKYDDFYWSKKVKNTAEDFLEFIDSYVSWINEDFYKNSEDFLEIKAQFYKSLYDIPLQDIPKYMNQLIENLDKKHSEDSSISRFKTCLKSSSNNIDILINKLKQIVKRFKSIEESHDFGILYDKRRQLFSIGYNADKNLQDKSHYDLLASEARQASFIAIAKNQIDKNHWFKLSRSMALASREKLLISWSGTMFEYLMPLIIMKSFPNTLLSETYKNVIKVQMNYARRKGIPWGISESAYYRFDVNSIYQYKAIGVPEIALDRNTANEIVVAPYASIMALQVDIHQTIYNIKRLIDVGAKGIYGFYEAVDYTKKMKLVKCFMVHHQGMSLMSLNNVLKNNIFQNRFHNIPRVKAVELLLQEKVPKSIVYNRTEKNNNKNKVEEIAYNMLEREYTTANTKFPESNIMSNGKYSVMVTNSGSGYSKKGEMTIYRWREDAVCDNTGMFFYIKNINSNEYWSASYEPCRYEGEEYKVKFSENRSEFKRKDGNLKTDMEITVSQEDDAEVRKISVTNNSNHVRQIEITSYLEVTLAPYDADLVHPAFSNLFIQTEFLENPMCLIASRRPRTKNAEKNWLMQTVAIEGIQIGSFEYETSRENFIGRDRDVSNPRAMDSDKQLSMTIGSVIDPVISIRVRVIIEPGKTCRAAYTTAVTNSREGVVKLAEKYRDIATVNRIFELSSSESNMQMQYLGLTSSKINMYQIMASRILFLNELMKKRSEYIKNIQKSQSSLWSYGISGDLPIMTIIIKQEKYISVVRQILGAHEYFCLKGLKVDLVIFNLEESSYTAPVQLQLRELIDSSYLRNKQNEPGGVFVYNSGNMPKEDMNFIKGISRLVIDSENGELFKQIKENIIYKKENNKFLSQNNSEQKSIDFKRENNFNWEVDTKKLYYFNGLGGFSQSGKSYIIVLKDYSNTPAPWINVISNSSFGFHVSESGIAYTWNKNSRENKLTAWTNDAVSDGEAEAIYIKDRETGNIWSISPAPIRDSGEYIIEHGFGYSIFKHYAYDIAGEITMFVDMNESVKLCRLKLKNNSKTMRKLSITYYAKLVMGVSHEKTAQYIFTNFNNKNEYIYSRNPYSEHFGNLICYLKIIGGKDYSYTGNREEFIGRGSGIDNPQCFTKDKLSNTSGAGFDPCLAESSNLDLDPNSEKEVLILFGQEDSLENIDRVIEKYNKMDKWEEEFENCKAFWNNFLETIQIKTPDKSMDIMLNGWLMYQSLACRYWARTAFYQSGGAYGFRDQLQDVMAIGYLNPDITRRHILYSTTRQYLEGDVQHWWHPIVDSGIRTRFSDDLLWLPYVTADYINNTGDYSILKEETNYLEDDPLKQDEDERYNISRISQKKGTVYEHCIKSIERASKFGSHNIPLMGSGDWNDGMSTVGNKGKGESVWLGWFLYSILDKFIPICRHESDNENVEKFSELKEFVRENLEKNAWDGSWYRRAYFDDGTPLGSIENDECRIDCIAQAWAVISKAAKESRAREAMEALNKNLVKKDKGMVLLLTPAFNNSPLEPGYIKGYLPGIRENGGQYTHGAIWSIFAFAELGYNNKAYSIFSMLNPINHSKSYINAETYKLEPYVIAADIYASRNNFGRGGWSWYTGAAGWMYRAGIESILGFKFKNNRGFTIDPCIPENWNEYDIKYKRNGCIYNIKVTKNSNKGIWLDDNIVDDNIIPFLKEGVHKIIVNI